MKKTIFVWAIFFFTGCEPATLEDLRVEGEVQTKKLALELKRVESKEDLQKALPQLRKRYHKIADLLLKAKQFPPQESPDSAASEELFVELARLYEMAGGRELIEMAQIEAEKKLQAEF